MDYTQNKPFDFQTVLEHLIGLLPEDRRSPEVIEKITEHLLGRVIQIITGLIRFEEVGPLIEKMENNPDLASVALAEYVDGHPDVQAQVAEEMGHFESLVVNLQHA